ncbi:MAG: flagellar motor protein MotB [Parvibaculaceae bacterium]|nr:flagellar motor protein MotB [Parvibaculaceae bacterium]
MSLISTPDTQRRGLNGSGGGLARVAVELGDTAESTTPLWLVTFADLMGILLVFFVLIFSMSKPEGGSWLSLLPNSHTSSSAQAQKLLLADDKSAISVKRVHSKASLNLGYLAHVLAQRGITTGDGPGPIGFRQSYRGSWLLLSRSAAGMFVTFTDELTLPAQNSLSDFAGVMDNVGNRLTVVIAVSAAESDEPWRLGLERARGVSKYLKQVGYEGGVTLVTKTVSSGHGLIELVIAPRQETET